MSEREFGEGPDGWKDVCKYINEHPMLMSMLYDIDLMPEQVSDDSPEQEKVFAITIHWRENEMEVEQATAKRCAETPAEKDVIAERRRQIEIEGWTAQHDDDVHVDNELARAARDYVQHYVHRSWVFTTRPEAYRGEEPDVDWPWDRKWWKPKDPRRDLVRAAALIIAQIEQLDRSAFESKGS